MAEKICITTDCVCDLPDDMLKKNNVDLMYFYITTDTGRFKDVDEITALNIFDYFRGGGSKIITEPPPVDEILQFFTEKLAEYDRIIHIAVSAKLSNFVNNAMKAVEMLGDDGKRVDIVDSQQVSTGIGHMVLRAAKMAKNGSGRDAIIAEMEDLRGRLSTTFLADSADYLYRNGKVSQKVQKLCAFFKIHPVLAMKDGYLKLKSCYIGSYEKSALGYVRRELKQRNIKTKRLFITHAGCSVSDIKMVKNEVAHIMKFDETVVTKASTIISGNCGPRTLGLFFIKEK